MSLSHSDRLTICFIRLMDILTVTGADFDCIISLWNNAATLCVQIAVWNSKNFHFCLPWYTRKWQTFLLVVVELSLIIKLYFWLTGWLAEWLADWMTGWMTAWMAGWITDWMTCWITGWMTCWTAGWMTGWITDWLNEWLFDLCKHFLNANEVQITKQVMICHVNVQNWIM